MSTVAENVVDTIAAVVVGLTKGTNLFSGPIREADRTGSGIPAQAVFVNDTASNGVVQQYNDGGSGTNLNMHSIQIIVRGRTGRSAYSNTRILANSVYMAIRKATPANTLGTEPIGSGPVYLGEDKAGSTLFSINITVYKRE